MRLYTNQHPYYCGIDLHARSMYVCVLNQEGAVLVHRNLPTTREAFEKVIDPYRGQLVVCVECIFSWYWIADVCSELGIAFVLGHALYMKAIHGGKTKNDRIDALKIATLLRGGMLPQAYVSRRGCGRPGTCCAGGSTWSASAGSCSPTSRRPATSTTSRR